MNRAPTERGAIRAAHRPRPAVIRPLGAVAPLVALLVLIQAVFAGRGLFVDTGAIDIHGGIGTATFLAVLIQTALVLIAGFGGGARMVLVGINLLLPLLGIVQLALGFSGRDGGQAAALHVPNGVLIFSLTVANAVLIDRYRRDWRSS